MITTRLIQYLKNFLPAHAVATVFRSLHQDRLVWQSLQDSIFLERIISQIKLKESSERDDWKPARLALIALNQPYAQRDPLENIDAALIRQVNASYPELIANPDGIDLARSGAIAIYLADRQRQGEMGWRFLSTEIEAHSTFPWETPLAILFGLVAQPAEVLAGMLEAVPSRLSMQLAIHALISNPLEQDEQAKLLHSLTCSPAEGLCARPLDHLDFIHLLAEADTELAKAYCQMIPGSLPPLSPRLESHPFDISSLLREAASLIRAAEIARIAQDANWQPDTLPQLSAMRSLLGASLTAALTSYQASDLQDELARAKLIAGWKQSLELARSVQPAALAEPYHTGLALTSAQAGQPADDLVADYSNGNTDLPEDAFRLFAILVTANEKADQTLAQAAGARLTEVYLREHTRALSVKPVPGITPLLITDALLRCGLNQEAIRILEAALEIAPNQLELLEKLADLQTSANQLTDASRILQVLSGLRPDDLTLRRKLALTYEACQNWHAAMDEWMGLVAEWQYSGLTDELDDLHALAQSALNAEQPMPALHAAQRALSLSADDGLAYTLMGQAYAQQHDLTRGMEALEKATQVSPEFPQTWIALADLQAQQQKTDQAIETLRTGMLSIPEHPELHYALGELMLRIDQPTAAVDLLRKAVGLSPQNTSYRYQLGLALNQLGRTQEAGAELEQAYDSAPENRDYAFAYGSTLVALGELSKALGPLEIATQSRTLATPAPYLAYASVVLELCRQKAAEVTAAAALSAVEYALYLDPDDAESKGWYAEALNASSNAPAAFTAYQEALETSLPDDRRWKERLSYGLGQVAIKLGHSEVAIAAAQEAISAAPQNPANYMLLSDACIAGGIFEDALRAARTALNLNLEEISNLTWFADQITRLVAAQNTAASPTFQTQARQALVEAQNALVQAIHIAPERVELMINLGRLQYLNGDSASARLTITQIASHDAATTGHLSQAAEQLISMGDTSGAILCLERAIAQLDPGASKDACLIQQQLAEAYTQKGELASASRAYEQALAYAPEMGRLYHQRAMLLIRLGKVDDALVCLDTGISLAQKDHTLPRLYFLAASLYRDNRDLSNALSYVQHGLELNQQIAPGAAAEIPALSLSDRLVLADIYRAALQPLQAYQMLQPMPGASANLSVTEQNERLQRLILKTELEMELGILPQQGEIDQAIQAYPAASINWLALQARLALRKGNQEQAEALYQAACKASLEDPSDQAISLAPGGFNQQHSISLLDAAFELEDWQAAQTLIQKSLETSPDEPISYFSLARSIVLKAERQVICNRLEILRHAPGESSLSSAEESALEKAIQQTYTLVQALDKHNEKYDLAYPASLLERWHSRGQIAFRPRLLDPKDIPLLQAAQARLSIKTSSQSQSPEETAAVIVAIGLLKGIESEQSVLTQILQVTRPHSRNAWVWFNAALALEDTYPQDAISAVRGVNQILGGARGSLAALNHILHARLSLRIKDLSTAEEAAEAALKLWPDEPRWHLLAAHIYRATSQREPQIRHLNQAATLEPNSVPVLLEIGQAYLAESEPDTASLAQAIHALEAAVKAQPGDVNAWIWLARAQIKASQIKEAASSVEQVLQLAPENNEAAVLQAEIALQQKSFQAAHEFAQSAVQASPKDPKTTLLLAKTFKSLNQPAEALEVLEAALPTAENPLPLQYERVNLIKSLQGAKAALDILNDLAVKYPEDATILTSLAQNQADLGDLQAAIQTAHTALKSGKSNLDAHEIARLHLFTGTLLRQTGQQDQAIQHLSEAVALSPQLLEAYLELGIARKERREYQQALHVFDQATQIAPQDPRPHYLAGLALKEGKDYKRSEMMLRRAAHLAPDDVVIRRQLAQVVALNVVHNARI